MPWGLWPPSTMNTGSRWSTSNRAGQRVPARPCRTALSEMAPALLPQDIHRGEHHRGVIELIEPHQGDAQVLPVLVGEGLPLQAEVPRDELTVVRAEEGAVPLRGHPLKDGLRLRILPVDHHVAVGLDDAGLGRGDLRHGAAQELGVVKTHGGDDGHLRRVDDVGGVQGAPHAHLQHHDVAPVALEVLHGDGGDELKLRGARRPCCRRGGGHSR